MFYATFERTNVYTGKIQQKKVICHSTRHLVEEMNRAKLEKDKDWYTYPVCKSYDEIIDEEDYYANRDKYHTVDLTWQYNLATLSKRTRVYLSFRYMAEDCYDHEGTVRHEYGGDLNRDYYITTDKEMREMLNMDEEPDLSCYIS